MALQVPTVTVDDLRAFHAKHFLHTPAPECFLHGVEPATEAVEEYYEVEDDGLGYYSDGARRTLTDEQIAMFRHSEIQSILRERRLRREDGEVFEDGNAPASPAPEFGSPTSLCINPTTPNTTTSTDEALEQQVVVASENTDKVQAGRIEKPKTQQWATSSARTKARNKKHNKNYRRKKKEDKKRKEAKGDGDEESDEWDPWHQATGPDVQMDDTVDLDY
ncbi:uncharacterized protein K460DRAFT_411106 [Cucurbitaria berberidis CBS 394.84]|uniref:Uncharacterized protein n=1 Tax=Cucurbitaria berberidis CBS 394.84 TaxID=1168544 RepID=A0A9P4G7L5_9PLEO|nr:uncharacterized protein K460DRAFT_411106 [Cucurbitaria berberidis CBS 394.84]KAF1840523.1 hypothetical protein K460DRAFT_411106 [Cucurbitaria berberidis CBS 394.84]